jgi:hypothetical protein
MTSCGIIRPSEHEADGRERLNASAFRLRFFQPLVSDDQMMQSYARFHRSGTRNREGLAPAPRGPRQYDTVIRDAAKAEVQEKSFGAVRAFL